MILARKSDTAIINANLFLVGFFLAWGLVTAIICIFFSTVWFFQAWKWKREEYKLALQHQIVYLDKEDENKTTKKRKRKAS